MVKNFLERGVMSRQEMGGEVLESLTEESKRKRCVEERSGGREVGWGGIGA